MKAKPLGRSLAVIFEVVAIPYMVVAGADIMYDAMTRRWGSLAIIASVTLAAAVAMVLRNLELRKQTELIREMSQALETAVRVLAAMQASYTVYRAFAWAMTHRRAQKRQTGDSNHQRCK